MAAMGEEKVGSFVGEHFIAEQQPSWQLSFVFSMGSRAGFSGVMCVDSTVLLATRVRSSVLQGFLQCD